MRIEAGKYYLNRAGETVGPMQRGGLFWVDQLNRPYFPDGRAKTGSETTAFDLVREWIYEDAEPHGETVSRGGHVPPPIPPKYAVPDPSYAPLIEVLKAAHEQAARGKGKERHDNGKSFDRQPIMEIGRMVGPGFAAGQAMKKAQEAAGMLERRDYRAAEAELLGAINYLAACVMLVRERAA